MKRFRYLIAGVVVPLLAIGLAGCNETLEERVHDKQVCEEAGGTYYEHKNGVTYTYWYNSCDLEENE